VISIQLALLLHIQVVTAALLMLQTVKKAGAAAQPQGHWVLVLMVVTADLLRKLVAAVVVAAQVGHLQLLAWRAMPQTAALEANPQAATLEALAALLRLMLVTAQTALAVVGVGQRPPQQVLDMAKTEAPCPLWLDHLPDRLHGHLAAWFMAPVQVAVVVVRGEQQHKSTSGATQAHTAAGAAQQGNFLLLLQVAV
jgi:hypothetical protein